MKQPRKNARKHQHKSKSDEDEDEDDEDGETLRHWKKCKTCISHWGQNGNQEQCSQQKNGIPQKVVQNKNVMEEDDDNNEKEEEQEQEQE